MKTKMRKSIFTWMLLTLVVMIVTFKEAPARAVLTSQVSYIGIEGCVVITSTYEHRFLGINWYTTTTVESPNCPGYAW